MRLISLKLLNFRRFKKQEIFFKDDFSLIFGKNGAGKSSILDAIGFAIFGSSSKDFVRVNTDLLKSHFLKQREPSKIELNFSYGLKEFKVVRIIDNGIKKFGDDFIKETKDTLTTNDGVEIIGGSEITNYLIKLLGVTRDTFLRSVFAKQKDLEVLSGGKDERKRLINNILGLDKIEIIILNIKKELKEKKITFDYIKSDIEKINIDEIKNNIELQTKEITELNIKFEEIKNQKKQYEEDYKKYKEIFDNNSKLKNQYTEINSKIDLNKSQINNITKNIYEKNILLEEISKKELFLEENKKIINWEKGLYKDLSEYNSKKEKFIQKNQIEKEISDKQIQLNQIEKEIEKFSKINFSKEIEKNNAEIKSLEETIQKAENNISKTKAESENITNLGKEIKQELEQIKNLGKEANCPTCKRPLEDYFPRLIELFEKDLAEKRDIFKNLTQKLSELEKEKQTFINNLNIIKARLEELKNSEKIYLVNNQKKEIFSKDLLELTEKIEIFKNIDYDEKKHNELIIEYQKAKNELQNYMIITGEVSKKEDFIEYIKKSNENINILNQEFIILKNALEKIDYNQETFIKSKEDFDNIGTKVFEINGIFGAKDKEILNKNFELTTLKNKLLEIESQKAKTGILANEILYLETKIKILENYILYLLNHLKPNIESIASQYFAIITDNKYGSISLDENYNILIDEKEIELYSGGEKDLANLCLRLSLGQNLSSTNGNPINFLILDEVLASQDKERQFNILINLKKLEKKFSQIILISHLDDIKDIATNIIEVKQKNLEESEINQF